MAILLKTDTKILIQGITGSFGARHTQLSLAYGTQVVAGVTPGKGGQKFENVTSELTTIVIDDDVTGTYDETTAYTSCGGTDTDGDDAPIRVDLFDDCLAGYFWKYDNNGLRILQLRFYAAS